VSYVRRIHVGIPAGGIITTAEDMAKYLSFQLNLGKVGDTQVVPEVELLKKLLCVLQLIHEH